MLCDEPRWRKSSSWAPNTASKSRILEKLNHDSRRSYMEMNVPKVGFTYARGFVHNRSIYCKVGPKRRQFSFLGPHGLSNREAQQDKFEPLRLVTMVTW